MNKILIIDDDRELCALIKRSVQSFKPKVYTNGQRDWLSV